MTVRDPSKELLSFLRRSPEPFAAGIRALVDAELSGSMNARVKALNVLQNAIADAMILSDLLGRRRLILEAKEAEKRRPPGQVWETMLFAAKEAPGEFYPIPSVTFEEAVSDLLDRTPELAPGYEAVQELYRTKHGFALAKSADIVVTKRVQSRLASLIEDGIDQVAAKKLLRIDLGDFSKSYAETVYRTNLSTAYSAGRFKQASDPDIAKVIGGFEYAAILDGDNRHNHGAADGLIASQFDPIWDTFTPPLGYNCRCSIILVDRWELEKMGLVKNGRVTRRTPANFSQAHPDPGFGRGRPDRQIYGG